MTYCPENFCLKLRLIDYKGILWPDIEHPETNEKVGNLKVLIKDKSGAVLYEGEYASGQKELIVCNVPGECFLSVIPASRNLPTGYPQTEPWNQLMLAADAIAYKMAKDESMLAVESNDLKHPSPESVVQSEEYKTWVAIYVTHGQLYLEEQKELQPSDGENVVTRPAQIGKIALRRDAHHICEKCGSKQSAYVVELAPLRCWVPALAPAKHSGATEWDAITACNLATMAFVAYGHPDNRPQPKQEPGKNNYDYSIKAFVDALNTQRCRPEKVIKEQTTLVLHNVPYSWHYHTLECYGMDPFAEANPTDSQAYAMTNKDTIIIGVRGTASAQDGLQDAKFLKTPFSVIPGQGLIHRGFAESFDYLWAFVKDFCFKHRYDSTGRVKKIFVTGHSLGGAVALLIACAIGETFTNNPLTLYTYAAPRVGDLSFVRYWSQRVPFLRHVYDVDPVPAAPPRFMGKVAERGKLISENFRHFGQLWQLSFFGDEKLPWCCNYPTDSVQDSVPPWQHRPGPRLEHIINADNAPWGPKDQTSAIAKLILSSITPGGVILFSLGARDIVTAGSDAMQCHRMVFYLNFLREELKRRYLSATYNTKLHAGAKMHIDSKESFYTPATVPAADNEERYGLAARGLVADAISEAHRKDRRNVFEEDA